MDTLSVVAARKEEAIGQQAMLQGWVRTRRDSKAGFSFLELNDGSCLANIQIICDGVLANYETEIKKLSAGCSVTVTGEVKPSGGKGQATELHAADVKVHGWADPEQYPLQKKRHSFEKLREWAHLRPAPTPLAPWPASATRFRVRSTIFFRSSSFSTSTRRSSPPAIAKGQGRCSA